MQKRERTVAERRCSATTLRAVDIYGQVIYKYCTFAARCVAKNSRLCLTSVFRCHYCVGPGVPAFLTFQQLAATATSQSRAPTGPYGMVNTSAFQTPGEAAHATLHFLSAQAPQVCDLLHMSSCRGVTDNHFCRHLPVCALGRLLRRALLDIVLRNVLVDVHLPS